MGTALAALVAFVESPVGVAFIAKVPTLVQDIIGIWHSNGTLPSAQVIADYLASAQAFNTLVPPKTTV